MLGEARRDTAVRLHGALKDALFVLSLDFMALRQVKAIETREERHTWSTIWPTGELQRSHHKSKSLWSLFYFMVYCYPTLDLFSISNIFELETFVSDFSKNRIDPLLAFNGFSIPCFHATKCWAKVKMPRLVNPLDS